MKVEQILQLIQAVSDSELTEFKYEEDGVKLSLKKTGDKIVQVQTPAVVPAAVQGGDSGCQLSDSHFRSAKRRL